MSLRNRSSVHKPRELRRRVLVPARLRHGASWSDACILNISSRGLMIHTGRQLSEGAEVEIRRADHVIVARVVWRDGGRAGLRAEERIAVEELVTLGQLPALQLTQRTGERRKHPRLGDQSRQRGRMLEFAGTVIIAASLALAGVTMMGAAFARPLTLVAAALAR